MPGNSSSTIYVGNLDEKLSDRVLYDILIQAGRVVDLYVPRDKETDRPKGYAFAQYESEEIAEYAVKLFTGLVTLYNRTLKFAISGQDKAPQNSQNGVVPAPNSLKQPRYPVLVNDRENRHHLQSSSSTCKVSSIPSNYSPVPPGVTHYSNGYGSPFNGFNYDNGRRVFGSTFDTINRSRSRRL
ncbi:hypothetical protein K2173_007132 [Erythroxylum novogranatense]|uniref:RRM domain-containing protein n=1 Tax=Erythroxylum novogranatense TaxID=1862640 RepID=A0AAV8SZN5_9ROSI|nr:hypothetical protein K2173_007132 [Erythroxylum novogranatense]